MRIILFLDFDLVLNNTFWADRPEHPSIQEVFAAQRGGQGITAEFLSKLFDPYNALVLKLILENRPEIKVILSTSWRSQVPLEVIRKMFQIQNIPWQVIGQTLSGLVDTDRAKEILSWIVSSAMESDLYIILDDLELKLPESDRILHIKTDPQFGLKNIHAARIFKWLEKKVEISSATFDDLAYLSDRHLQLLITSCTRDMWMMA